MTFVSIGRFALLALSAAVLASPASAIPVSWDINPAESNFRLAIPDQTVTLGTITATMRLRNQNNAAWTTNNAPVDGFLGTNVGAGVTSIEFLAGGSSLVGVDTGTYRPNPAAFSTAATSTVNTAGSYTNTSSDSAVYAARVNASALGGAVQLNLGYISFDTLSYDLASIVTAVIGTSFVSNAVTVGILDSRIAFDGITSFIGQPVPDALGMSGPIAATNINGAAGSIVPFGPPGNYRISIPINMPVAVSLSGVNLTAVATGTIVGYAFVPEPATLGLVALGLVGIGIGARRRRS